MKFCLLTFLYTTSFKNDFLYSRFDFTKKRGWAMKYQKLILPVLIIAIGVLLYFSYFGPKDDLGLFSEFDKNSNANRDIIVKVLSEKGFMQDTEGGGTIFYVEDGAGMQVKVLGPLSLPPGMDVTKRVTLRGHYHGDYFHASEVRIRN